MKNIHWISLGVAHVLLNVILGIHFSPNLNTGFAQDAYKYIGAFSWFSLSPIIFYWYICREPAKQLNKTSYGLNVGTVLLFGGLIIIAYIFLLYNLDFESTGVENKFDFQDFIVANVIVCFVTLILFSALGRVAEISDEITSNHELNIAKKLNIKTQIESLYDELIWKTKRDARVEKVFEKIIEELVYLPNQIPMNHYTIFNQKTSDFIVFSNKIFQDFAVGSFDSDSKIEEFSVKANALIRTFSEFKNTK